MAASERSDPVSPIAVASDDVIVRSVPARLVRQSLPSRQEQLRLVASPVKASALIAEAANVLQSRSSSGHNSAPTPRPRSADPSGPGLLERGPFRSKSQGTRQLARIEGVVTEIQRELNEVKVLSDSLDAEPESEQSGFAPLPPPSQKNHASMLGACANVQEPRCPGVTEPTVLVHVAGGISPASARAKVHGSHMSQGATLLHPRGGISPAFLYPAGFSNSTQSWQRELEDRKWRANAEHILKIESSWAQRVKEAEEAAARSDERARVAEEAHGRLLREKADMADAARLREKELVEELAQQSETRDQMAACETSLREALAALKARTVSAEKRAEDEQAALEDELKMVSSRFEEQLQHCMELKKELTRMREELDAGRKEETKHREAEREWRQRVEELKSGLATARDTIQAQKIQIATMTSVQEPNAHVELEEAVAHLKAQLAQASAKLEDQYRLTAHLQQKLTSLEDELAAAHRLSQSSQLEMGCAEDSQLAEAEAEALELRVQLQSELKERDEAISAATRQMEMCEALNKELDQAVADLQIDLAACKQKEEGHDATVESLQQEVRSKDEAVQEWKAHAQQWQVRASQLETELDAQVRTLGDSVRQVTDSAAQIANLERELRSSKESAERSQVALASLQQQVLELEAEAGSRNAERELQDLATAELHSRAASLEEELCAEQDRCQALACRVETTGNELSQTREDLATAKAESVEDRAQLANAADHGDRLREEHLALQKAVEHQHGLEADAHAEATSLKVALEAATEKNMLLETTTQIMQQEVDALEAETASARARAGEDQLHITKLQHALETLEEEVVTGKKLQEAQLGTHADLHRAMVQTEDQLARALRSDEMQQELTAKLRTSLGASEVSLSQYRASLEAAEAMESQLRKQLDTLRTESKEQKKTATDLNIKLAQSEEERNASDTAFETLRSIEGDLRGQLAQEAEQLSEVRSALQVQQSVNGQLEQSLTATVSELSQTRAEASAQESVAQQLEQKLAASEEKLQRHADSECTLEEQVALVEASLATALSASELQAAAATELQQSCDHLQAQMRGLQSELNSEVQTGQQQLKSKSELQEQVGRLHAEVLELQLHSEATARLEIELKEKKQHETELEHNAAIAEAEVAGARNSAKAQQKLVAELRNCLRDSEAESARALSKLKDEQDRLEHRQHDTEHRLEVAEGAARQYAQELQELTGEHRARLSGLEGDLARACSQQRSHQEAAEDLKSDLSKRETALLHSLATSEAHEASEAALRKALHMQEKLLADHRVDHDAALRQLVDRASEVEELQQRIAELQARKKEQEVLQQKVEQRLHQTEASTDAKLRDAAAIEASLREKLQDVWGKLASRADLGVNADTLSDPLLYSLFERKASKMHRKLAAAMRRAGDAHHAALELELSRAWQTWSEPHMGDGGQVMLQSLLNRSASRRDSLVQELQEMLAQVQSTLLLKCAEGADTGSDDEELAAERLELDAQLISQELALLKSRPLDGIPDSVRKAMAALCGICLDGPEDMDMDGRYPMHWAAREGRRDVVEFLLRYICTDEGLNQRDPEGRTPLFYAERAGNDALAAFLRDNGCDANPQEPVRRRPVTSTVPDAFADVIKVVEERGWHAVNWMEGFTLLHWAAEKGLADFCRYFVDLNADVNAVDSRGRTALQCAMDSKNTEAELALRELMGLSHTTGSQDPGAVEEEPSELHELASSMSSEQTTGIPVAYVRVMEQIDLVGWERMQWARGFTLLHWAAKHDRADLCELFLWHGADPNHQDELRRSALDYARLRQPEASSALQALLRGKPAVKPSVC